MQSVDDSMTGTPSRSALPQWLWAMAGLAIIWNLLGLLAFLGQVLTDPADISDDQAIVELYKNIPLWVNVCFGAAVIGGTLGSILLFMGSRWSIVLFLVSLIGILGQQSYMFFLSDTLKVMGNSAALFPIIVLLIAIWLLYVAYSANRQGLLR